MFGKIGKKRHGRVRHQRLMCAAATLVHPFEQPATPADLVALVFGRHQIELTEEEAARYLDAARVQLGHRLGVKEVVDNELTDELTDEETATESEVAAP